MKPSRLWIGTYKNLRDCEVPLTSPSLLQAIIGGNGSGKSNLIEVLLQILIGAYFRECPPFDFVFEYHVQGRDIRLEGRTGTLHVSVDGQPIPIGRFADRLRDGPGQVYYPELTLAYYSGDCLRVRSLLKRYQRAFEVLTRQPGADALRPMFVEASTEQARGVLLALIAHAQRDLLDRVGVRGAVDIAITIKSPRGFDPQKHEPKLWNTEGAVRRIISALDDTASSSRSERRVSQSSQEANAPLASSEERTYLFQSDQVGESRSLAALASRLGRVGDNLYLALGYLQHRGMLKDIRYRVIGGTPRSTFEFGDLSEGEKQLIAVVGSLKLAAQPHSFVLLDEPDTHLNPAWSWEYTELLTQSLGEVAAGRSTIVLATHDPVMISGLLADQVLVAHPPADGPPRFRRPRRDPRGQGVANLLSSPEFFGLPSSLDKQTQQLLDERLGLVMKDELTAEDRLRLAELNASLEMVQPGVSERDPHYAAFLRERLT